MHIYLLLFLTFLEIGAFTFGGGHAMISLIREKVLMYEWMTNEELLNFIAFAESSPGPIAINMATFVGSSQAGLIGAIIATVAVVLPSFLMILLIVYQNSHCIHVKCRTFILSYCFKNTLHS